MTKHILFLFPALLILAAPSALAQTAPQSAGEATSEAAPAEATAAEATAAEATPAEPAVPAAAPEAAQPASRESEMAATIEALQSKVAGLEETSAAQEAAISSASKLKFSGYVQGRYEWHDGSTNGATFSSTGTATATNGNRFLVRHAYFKAAYKGTNTEAVFQVDGNNKDGLAIKDVYATFVDTWTPLNLKLSVGQFNYPFGYELLQSNSAREMPERAVIHKFFFDGERDRGARLEGSYEFFNFAVALVNGTVFDGTKNLAASKDPAPFGSNDPNEFKDWVGRLGVDLGEIVGGVSGYFGKGLYITPPTATSAAIPDSRWKYRLGADVQGYIDLPGVGGLALKGEVIYGKDTARQYHGIAADPCKSSATWGFILTAVQNISGDFGAFARVDMKDTLEDSIAAGCKEKTAAQSDRVITAGGGLLYYASSSIRATVSYEHPTEQAGAKKDNDFAMAQLQAKF